MSKQIVHYRGTPTFAFGIAFVEPVDHTSPLVSNTKVVRTSLVRKEIDENGIFETQNTVYVPYKNNKEENGTTSLADQKESVGNLSQ